jgi:hypothetical protein
VDLVARVLEVAFLLAPRVEFPAPALRVGDRDGLLVEVLAVEGGVGRGLGLEEAVVGPAGVALDRRRRAG